jgi:hypothetical protein
MHATCAAHLFLFLERKELLSPELTAVKYTPVIG